jgi:hypothetical protein
MLKDTIAAGPFPAARCDLHQTSWRRRIRSAEAFGDKVGFVALAEMIAKRVAHRKVGREDK